MRILIASPITRLEDSLKFAQALNSIGIEAIFMSDLNYYALFGFKNLKRIPFPKLLKLIKTFKPDFTFTYVPYYSAQITKLLNRPLLAHLVGDLWMEWHWNKTLCPSLPIRMLFEWKTLVMRWGLRKADIILPVSKWLEKRVKQHLPNYPTQVLHVGIDPKEWRVKPNINLFKLEHPAVVGIFDLEIYPKVAGLIKFMDCIKKMPEVRFYFAGDGPYTDLIERKRPSNMVLLGRLSKSGVQKLLARGDVFVHPSGLDAMPRSVMEASLMKKPIVASNIGGIPEIVKDNETGYLCDINDTEQWIEKIRFLLEQPVVGKRLGENARKYVVKKFNWKEIAKEFIKNLMKNEI